MLQRSMTEPSALDRLRDEVDRLIGRFFGEHEQLRAWVPTSLRRHPSVNVWQDDDNVFVEAELPGQTERDIELTVSGNELTIKGERVAPESGESAAVLRRERWSGAFCRVVHLPLEVETDGVEAAFSRGVLTITLPKAAVARARHIKVKASG